jgi:hypothetical protein
MEALEVHNPESKSTAEGGVKSNKLRAKEHRARKKDYIQKLEEENKRLKITISELEYELKKAKEEAKECIVF